MGWDTEPHAHTCILTIIRYNLEQLMCLVVLFLEVGGNQESCRKLTQIQREDTQTKTHDDLFLVALS